MKKSLIITLCSFYSLTYSQINPPNPYASFGEQAQILTLSKGRYPEFFSNDTLVRLGTVMFNTITKQVEYFIDKNDSTYLRELEIEEETSRWMSVDPLAHKYPDMSPYCFVGNNPIRYIDSDGRVIVDANGNEVKITFDNGKANYIFAQGTSQEVIDKFNANSAPFIEILNSSDVGKKNLQFLKDIPTAVSIDPTLPDPKPGDNSTVNPTSDETIKKDGKIYYKSVEIIPDLNEMQKNADQFNIQLNEKISATLSVETGHLNPEQIKIDNGKGDFSTKYNNLINESIRAAVSYRLANKIPLDETLFTPTDNLKQYGFELDKANTELRNQVQNISKTEE